MISLNERMFDYFCSTCISIAQKEEQLRDQVSYVSDNT